MASVLAVSQIFGALRSAGLLHQEKPVLPELSGHVARDGGAIYDNLLQYGEVFQNYE